MFVRVYDYLKTVNDCFGESVDFDKTSVDSRRSSGGI